MPTANTPATPVLNPGVSPREAWAWAMYDFANSGYTTVVITAVFNAYFVRVVAGDAPWATLAWTAALAASYLLLIVLGPLLGAWADLNARKKRLLGLSTAGCVLFTWTLALAGPGDLALAVVALVLSNFFFGAGENLVSAFLPELATERHRGKLSGWGWGLGYVGGLAALGLSLAYIHWARGQGHGAEQFVPATLAITGALFLIAALPTLLWLRERAVPQTAAAGLIGATLARFAHTWADARRYVDLRRLLGCIVLYQAGVATVIALAAIYAQQVLGFGVEQSLQLVLIVNLSAIPGSVLLGHLQDRIGHVPALALTLVGWLAAIGLIWGAQGQAAFWVAANLAGLCLGASQAIGRAFVSIMIPANRLAEFFGLWGLAVRLAAILGPLTYGLVTWLTAGDHRLALLITGVYFLLGLAGLATVNADRGRRTASGQAG